MKTYNNQNRLWILILYNQTIIYKRQFSTPLINKKIGMVDELMILHHCLIILLLWYWCYPICQIAKSSKIGWPWMKNQSLRQIQLRTAVLTILYLHSDLLSITSGRDFASPWTDCYDDPFAILQIWRSTMLVISSGLKHCLSPSVSSQEKCADFGKSVQAGDDTWDDLLRDLCRWPAERSKELENALDPWDTSVGEMMTSERDVNQTWTIFLHSLSICISTHSIDMHEFEEIKSEMVIYNQPQSVFFINECIYLPSSIIVSLWLWPYV